MATTTNVDERDRPQSGGVLTVREYATREGITLGTAYRRIWAGQVYAQQFFGRWLIRDLEPSTLPKTKPSNAGTHRRKTIAVD
jgi:hypothetical protein